MTRAENTGLVHRRYCVIDWEKSAYKKEKAQIRKRQAEYGKEAELYGGRRGRGKPAGMYFEGADGIVSQRDQSGDFLRRLSYALFSSFHYLTK